MVRAISPSVIAVVLLKQDEIFLEQQLGALELSYSPFRSLESPKEI